MLQSFAPTGTRPVRWYNYAAYGANDVLGAGSMAVISGWILFFYTTAIPTDRRLYTLMHDPQYRLSVAWQNVAYNQPTQPGFYLGEGMPAAPKSRSASSH